MSLPKLNGITVCVDYGDLLKITLPVNRHHFDKLLIVTSPDDVETQQVAFDNNCNIFPTKVFWDDGALFNKWKALELGLDSLGRNGWLCLIDPDVIWPENLLDSVSWEQGKLYGSLRHMMRNVQLPIPPQSEWNRFPIHANVNEWAGYTQIFHAEDPVLGNAPWHEIDWKHAGGADSFFQMKWRPEDKIRTKANVLHLGEAGQNWCGRVTDRLDGKQVLGADEKAIKMNEMFLGRRGKSGRGRFDHEKIKPS